MATYKKFRSREVVLAKPIDHDFGYWNPRTSQREQGRSGDYLTRDGSGHETVVPKERFVREWEELPE